jgi:GGDEF domain-containing protein
VSDAEWEAGSLYALDGESLRRLLEDVDSVRAAYRLPRADLDLVRSLALAWSEAALGRYARVTCTDPLTGLATAQHLQTEVMGLVRRQEAGAWALAVAEVGVSSTSTSTVPHGMLELIVLSDVAAVVARELPAHTLMAGLAPTRFAALVPSEDAIGLIGRIDGQIRAHLAALAEPHAARTWIERLPQQSEHAATLIDELCR